mmetsp:Transcript_11317/g.20691  ORF Transcript_11317/g.20691 Transcript_11317/m.20691 type:complete len:247 (-) Transcript_11317:1071-1811(-)
MHNIISIAPCYSLVAANYCFYAIPCTEGCSNIATKGQDHMLVMISRRVMHTKSVLRTGIVRNWIRPEHVVENWVPCQGVMVHRPLGSRQLAQLPSAISDASMHYQNLARKNAAERQPLKGLVYGCKHTPTTTIPKPLATMSTEPSMIHSLILKVILVVAAEEPDALREHHFEGKDQAHHLQLVLAAINPVTVEYQSGPSSSLWEAPVKEMQQHIPELTMKIAIDLCRYFGLHKRRLRSKYLLHLSS